MRLEQQITDARKRAADLREQAEELDRRADRWQRQLGYGMTRCDGCGADVDLGDRWTMQAHIRDGERVLCGACGGER